MTSKKIIFHGSKQGAAFFLYLVPMCNPLFLARLCNESYKVESTCLTHKKIHLFMWVWQTGCARSSAVVCRSDCVGAEVGLMIQPYDIARQTKQEKNVTNENVKKLKRISKKNIFLLI